MSASASQVGAGLSWVRLGSLLDATDFGLFNLVPRPALTELLDRNPTIAQIGAAGLLGRETRGQDLPHIN